MSIGEDNLIKFKAVVSKVQTMADGGLRVILDMPETAIETATKMMQAKRMGAILEIVAVPVNDDLETILSEHNHT